MLHHPGFDPVLLPLWGPLAIRWYGLMYLVAFAIGLWLLARTRPEPALGLPPGGALDLAFTTFMGGLAGGRLGYVLLYDLPTYLAAPWRVVAVWEGGMAIHGGLAGALLAGWWFCRRRGVSFLRAADVLVPLVPIGMGFGRIGNFINGELWGRPADVPWAMVFPGDPLGLPRHPSQLYEAGLEGALLFAVLWAARRAGLPPGGLLGLFLAGYGGLRIFAEAFREPDAHLGLVWGSLTMGMTISLPLVAAGVAILALVARRPPAQAGPA